MFKDSKYELWHANAARAPPAEPRHQGAALRRSELQRPRQRHRLPDRVGLHRPDDAGLPREANKYADRVGRVMNYGDGLYGGMFFAAMYAAAFFESDPRKVVETGLRSIPADSGYGQLIRDVLDWSRRTPGRLAEDLAAASRTSGTRTIPAPTARSRPSTSTRKLNGAYVALGLLYGERRLREDARGLDARRPGLRLQPVERRRHPRRDARLRARSRTTGSAASRRSPTRSSPTRATRSTRSRPRTMARALKVIECAGGTVTATEVVVPPQEPKAPKLEQWSPDRPDRAPGERRSGLDLGRGLAGRALPNVRRARVANGEGAEAVLRFRGTGTRSSAA